MLSIIPPHPNKLSTALNTKINMPHRAVRIPDEVWGRHRPAIEQLYLTEGRRLEGEDGVIDIMAKRNGLSAVYVLSKPDILSDSQQQVTV